MKTKIFYIACIAAIQILTPLFGSAQDQTMSEQIKKQLSASDLKKIEASAAQSKEAEDLMVQVESLYKEIAELETQYTTAKKKKQKTIAKDIETKKATVNKLRLEISDKQSTANTTKYNVYAENLKKIKKSANEATKEAGEEVEINADNYYRQSVKKRKEAKTITDTDNQLKIINEAYELERRAIEEQEIAFEIYLNWSLYEEEDFIAENKTPETESTNTDKNQNEPTTQTGNTSTYQAKEGMITESGIIYQIQIIATHRPLTAEKLKQVYNTQDIINTKNEDGLYKYRVGVFRSYAEAKKFKDEIGVPDAFVIALKDGEKINILDAIAQTE